MPYRSDASLWCNLPGAVAALQPIGAPGSLLARYNQAHGGDNRYKATDGVAPVWSGVAGWTFNGSTEWLDSGILPTATTSMLVRYSDATAFDVVVFGSYSGNDTTRFTFYAKSSGSNAIAEHAAGLTIAGGAPSAGVVAIAGQQAYLDGSTFGGTIPGTWSGTATATIGIAKQNGHTAYGACKVQAVLIVERTLSPAEVWQASRQMAYCHANPDWSAWGRRRRYYYAPSEAAAM